MTESVRVELPKSVLVRIFRPEDYEDVCDELVAGDVFENCIFPWKWEVAADVMSQLAEQIEKTRAAEEKLGALQAEQSVLSGMRKVSETIAYFQDVINRFGDSCVYIRPGGCSWGAVALNREAFDAKSPEDQAREKHSELLHLATMRAERLAEIAEWMDVPEQGMRITDWWKARDKYKADMAELVSLRTSQAGLLEELTNVRNQCAGYGWGYYGTYRGKSIVVSEEQLKRVDAAISLAQTTAKEPKPKG